MLVEVNARTYTQLFVMIQIYVANAIVNAVLFGVFVEQFQVIRKRETDYQEKIDGSNAVMKDILLDKPIKKEIRKYNIKKNEKKQQKTRNRNIKTPEKTTKNNMLKQTRKTSF